MPPLSERVAPPETPADFAGIISENRVQNEVDALNVDIQAQDDYYTPFYTELCQEFGVDPTKPGVDVSTPITDQVEKGRYTLDEPEAAGRVAVGTSIELIITQKRAQAPETAAELASPDTPSPWFMTPRAQQKPQNPPPMWPPISAPPVPVEAKATETTSYIPRIESNPDFDASQIVQTIGEGRPTAAISVGEANRLVATAETDTDIIPITDGDRLRIGRGHGPLVEPKPIDKPAVQRTPHADIPYLQPRRLEPKIVHNTVKPVAVGQTSRIPEPVPINGLNRANTALIPVVPVVPGKKGDEQAAPEPDAAKTQVIKQPESAPETVLKNEEIAKVRRLQRVGNWIKKIIGRDVAEDKYMAEFKNLVLPPPPVLRKGETVERPMTSNTTAFGTPRRRVSSNPKFERDADDSEAMERAKKFQAIDEEKLVAAENEEVRQKRLARVAKFFRGATRTVVIGGVYPVVDKVYPMVETYMQHRGR